MGSDNHKTTKENRVFLDRLTDFLGNSDNQTSEEIKAELREQGIAIDNMINNCKNMINEKVGEAKRQWLIDAPKLRDKMQKQIESYLADIPADMVTLKSKIKEMMDLGEYQKQARAFFRDLNEITDEDLRTLYKDFVILMNLQKDGNQDDDQT